MLGTQPFPRLCPPAPHSLTSSTRGVGSRVQEDVGGGGGLGGGVVGGGARATTPGLPKKLSCNPTPPNTEEDLRLRPPLRLRGGTATSWWGLGGVGLQDGWTPQAPAPTWTTPWEVQARLRGSGGDGGANGSSKLREWLFCFFAVFFSSYLPHLPPPHPGQPCRARSEHGTWVGGRGVGREDRGFFHPSIPPFPWHARKKIVPGEGG